MTKYQLITGVYESTVQSVTENPAAWTAFLRSACRNYKCRFDEQILIYTQRPDATAALEIEKWNRLFGRWVNKGAKGIAVFDDEHNGNNRLKHYFDISDTHESRSSRPVPLWQMRPEYEAEVIESLENSFGDLDDKSTLVEAIVSAARNAVEDNMSDYLADLMICRDGSALEPFDEGNLENEFRFVLHRSVAYMMLTRCGIDADKYLSDFRPIVNFDTTGTVNALGLATSDIAEMCLREIASTVLSMERQDQKQNRTFAMPEKPAHNEPTIPVDERGAENGSVDLSDGGRLSSPELDRAGGGAGSPWQIRITPKEIPERAPARPVSELPDSRRVEHAPDGDRADGQRTHGADDHADGGGAGRDRGDESVRPDEVGGADEQHPPLSRGDDTPRPDIRLKPLPTEDEQLADLGEAEDTAKGHRPEPVPSAFSMPVPQETVDREICPESGGGIFNKKYCIYHFFEREQGEAERIIFLKNESGVHYGHTPLDEHGFSVLHDSKGITFTKGNSLNPDAKYTLTWKNAVKRIGELIAADRYLNPQDKELYPQYLEYLEQQKILREKERFIDEMAALPPAEKRDTLSLRLADYLNGLEWYEKEYLGKHGLSEIADATNAAQIEALLQSSQKTQQLMTALAAIKGATSGVFARNHAWRFGQELEALHPRQHVYKPGDTVYIGTQEYEVLALDETTVRLYDPSFPLLNREMTCDEFDRKIAESGLNEHLLAVTEPEHQPGYESWSESATTDEPPHTPDTGEASDNVDAYPPEPTEPIWEKTEGGEVTKVRIDLMPTTPQQTEPTITPAWEKERESQRRGRANVFDPRPEIPMSERHNFRITDDDLGTGGAKNKFRGNVEAIRTLQTIEQDNRFATPEEQEILSRYVGWGALQEAFDESKPAWVNEYRELKDLLTPEEYASARASTLNAHYTSPAVIKAIYQAVENMGFKSGNVLEPSCGIGNFFGLVPQSMADCKMFGVELDGLTGRIARQLYQKNNIAIQGFEKTDLPDSFFDLAIGNVPFGSYGVSDKRYDKHKFNIHDYFFARTLDKVRPGGVVAFVTSRFTLDKKDPTVRRYIAQRADLLGAIRLPMTAFKANAGTEVTADIIFLQKRDRATVIEPDWIHLGEISGIGTDGQEIGVPVNSYFVENPDMILGTMSNDSGTRMYGAADSYSCVPFPDADLSEQLTDAITNIHARITDYERTEDEPEEDNSIPADPNVRNFSYTLVSGQIYYRQDSRMVPMELPVTTQNRVKGMIELRECVRNLIMYQTEDYPDGDINREQAKLNRLYDSYTKKYGLINSRGNSIAFSQDSAYCLLCSLEVLDENGELERKADMFNKRTIKAHVPITRVDTATEALAVSMNEKARVDLAFMSELTDMSEDALDKELEGVIFLNVGMASSQDKTYVTADEYLSGNIREKLERARAAQAAVGDGSLDINVKALEAAMPPDLTAGEISVRLGATWVPEDVIQQFMEETLQMSWRAQNRIKVHYSTHSGEWNITEKSADRSNIHTFNTFGTQRVNAYKIIEDSLNLRDVRVFDKVHENGDEKRVLNKKETAIAQAKQEIIRTKFEEWIWKDPARRERLCRIFNDKFNSIRPRVYDGSHLTFPGMNPEISLRKHQVDAIAHILYGGNTLLAHEVGAGKTYEMVAAAMESKRIGLCRKSLIVVPNHITEQWAAEFLQLYPSANILVATRKDFETKNRKKFCARITTGDYDAVIIGHSQFEKIPMSVERQQAMLERQIDELVDGVAEIKRNKGEKFTIKQMEKTRKSLELKLEKLNEQGRKDDVVTFEELGIDRLFIDESHYYKNLLLVTKMRNVAGIAQVEAQKSSDLFMKTQYLDEEKNGRGTVFATGTPISNSMVELYTVQRYLQYKELVKQGLQHFDAWASTFGQTVTAIELAPEGTGFRSKTRFAKFYNLPELMSMFRMVADIQTGEMLKLPVPKANFHNEVIKPSEWQKEMVLELADRAEKIRDGDVDPKIDNMLLVTNDGRKLALDQRIINPMLPDEPEGKVSTCANNVFRIWEEHKDKRSTQLVFSDLSTPKGDGSFNVYDDLKQKLIAKGIPEHEVAFIHNADTETKKKELFAKVRKGQVRVLIGSTQKMGAGTNVQDRLIALHDLDAPWRPSDLAQRLGRIVRQGNKNPEVEIFRYVTEGTFDGYMFQLIENKQKFIAQIMTGKVPVRMAEDIDETALSYAEIKALATGNPLIIEKAQLESDVNKLKILHASHLNQKYALEDKIHKEYPREMKRLTERIDGYTKDIQTAAQHTPADKDSFPPMKIGGILYAEKADAGKALIEACKAMTSPDAVPLGEYRGFQMILSFDSFGKEYKVTLAGALSHTVALGTDIHGNITRLDNRLEGFAAALTGCKDDLAGVQKQMESAKSEVDRPFPQDTEFKEKSARLKELDILLNMDQKDNTILDMEPDEGDMATPTKKREQER